MELRWKCSDYNARRCQMSIFRFDFVGWSSRVRVSWEGVGVNWEVAAWVSRVEGRRHLYASPTGVFSSDAEALTHFSLLWLVYHRVPSRTTTIQRDAPGSTSLSKQARGGPWLGCPREKNRVRGAEFSRGDKHCCWSPLGITEQPIIFPLHRDADNCPWTHATWPKEVI